jgi:ADP-ribose pyrophosphatase YjhB (NUDIX family)
LAAPDPRFVVNVEVFLHHGDRWLLIRRGDPEEHAAGTLAGVGGKVEAPGLVPEALEATARREAGRRSPMPPDVRPRRTRKSASEAAG